jgi:NADPH-dependent 2,4-dienoyl-CoA reductase/sulfur reductase-like enzyme/rhodanese-related sulfurtransferase
MPGMKIVVIGGVAAGPKAAARARRLAPEAEITILERGNFVSYAACGIPYLVSGETPDLKDILSTPVGVVRDAGFFKAVKDIRVLTGKEAVALNRGQKQVIVKDRVSGYEEVYPYDKLVLATGASAVKPKIDGIDLKNIFLLRQPPDVIRVLEALEEKPKTAVIIGAGLIGLEMAEALTVQGLEVTVVEALGQILPGLLDWEMAAMLQRQVKGEGVKIRTAEKVSRCEGGPEGKVARVITDKGAYGADLVIVAVGVRPEVGLARDAGLELGGTGAIKVDQFMRTSDEDIYAGGDCVENFHRVLGRAVYVSSGQMANVHGRIIGTNITGGRAVFQGMVGTAVARFFGYTVGCTGLTESVAACEGHEVVTALAPGLDKAHYYPGAKFMGVKIVADRPTGRLLGVQIVGPGDGAKRLDVAATALTMCATVENLVQLNLGYSPPFSTAIDALAQAAQVVENKMAGVAQALSPGEVEELTRRGEDFMLLDVRTPQEFREVRLKHPKAFAMPLGKLREKAADLPKDKLYIPFCKFSMRGYEAQKILEGLGFKKVKFMDGGVVHWPYELEK